MCFLSMCLPKVIWVDLNQLDVTNVTTHNMIISECHKCHIVTMLPEGGLVSCGGSQQCHTLLQEGGFDGLTLVEAFGSGDHHHYDGEDDGDDDDDDQGDDDNEVDTLMVWNLTSMLFCSRLNVELSLAAHNSFSLRQTSRTVEFSCI